MPGKSIFVGEIKSFISQSGIDDLDNLVLICLGINHLNRSNAIYQINTQRKKRKQLPLCVDVSISTRAFHEKKRLSNK